MSSLRTVQIADYIEGAFAENKDIARMLREQYILPLAESKRAFTVDFRSVDLSTQSFIHALLSEALMIHGESLLDRMKLENCNKVVRELILTVVDYTLNPADALTDDCGEAHIVDT